MDIRNILKEHAFGVPMAYKHLDPLHVGVLRKIAAGKFDPEVTSEKVQAVVDDLVGFGLVSDLSFEITPEGVKALKYVEQLGGSTDRRQAVAARANRPTAGGMDAGAGDYEID